MAIKVSLKLETTDTLGLDDFLLGPMRPISLGSIFDPHNTKNHL